VVAGSSGAVVKDVQLLNILVQALAGMVVELLPIEVGAVAKFVHFKNINA
jgi:hypothetical protein